MSKTKLNLIAAACENLGIGINGDLPWRLKTKVKKIKNSLRLRIILLEQSIRKEMAYFSSMTSKVRDPAKKNAVVMGRRTWDCIPSKFLPLPNRVNIVLTRHVDDVKSKVPEGVIVVSGLDEAISHIEGREDIESTWVIGGSSIYKAALEHKNCGKIYLTEIQKNFECDTFFPKFDKKQFVLVTEDGVPEEQQVEGDISYYFRIYKKL